MEPVKNQSASEVLNVLIVIDSCNGKCRESLKGQVKNYFESNWNDNREVKVSFQETNIALPKLSIAMCEKNPRLVIYYELRAKSSTLYSKNFLGATAGPTPKECGIRLRDLKGKDCPFQAYRSLSKALADLLPKLQQPVATAA